MSDDNWNFETYHKDLQEAYHALWGMYSSLGSFREPHPNDSGILKRVMNDVQTLMRVYPVYFPDFVDQLCRDSKGSQQVQKNESGSTNTGLRKSIDPLIKLSFKLEEGLRGAELFYDGDAFLMVLWQNMKRVSDIFCHLDPQFSALTNARIAGSFNVDTDTPVSPSPRKYHDSPTSKRTIRVEEGGEEPLKKIRVASPTPVKSSSFSTRSFSKATSESTASSTFRCAGLYRITGAQTPFSRTSTSSSIEQTEYLETSSTSSRSYSTSSSTITTPSTSFSLIPTAGPSFSSVDSTPQIDVSERTYGSIKVTHDDYIAYLTRSKVNFYVQWELERLISQHDTISWSDFEFSDFGQLKGLSTVQQITAIHNLMDTIEAKNRRSAPVKSRKITISDRKALLFSEIDNEEASIAANDLRGIGNNSIDWSYGGKIQYVISVQHAEGGEGCSEFKPDPPTMSQVNNVYLARNRQFTRSSTLPSRSQLKSDNPLGPDYDNDNPSKTFPFKFVLGPPDMPGKSFRLARRYGSRRIISLITKDITNRKGEREKLKEMLLGRCLIILGRPYRALWATAEGSVMMIETSEKAPGVMSKNPDPKMPSFLELLSQYNALERKPNQAMAKWAARPQILFSDSVPAAKVEASAIGEIPDIVTAEAQLTNNPKTEQILTDGCGLMSESLAQRIYHHPSLTLNNGRPSVIQMRVGGSKGLLALMSATQAAQHPGKEILLRDSMIKSLSAPGYERDQSLLTVDVLKCECLKIGTTLTSEAMIAMVHNGVPIQTFVKMAENEIDSVRKAFLPEKLEGESSEDVLSRIYSNCNGMGGVGMERKKRAARDQGQSLRAAGLAKGFSRGNEDIEADEGDDPLIVSASQRFDIDPISGQPGSIGEALMESVASGFHPANSAYPASKLHHLVDQLSKKMVKDFKIPVPQSLTSFIVPDSLQILAPDEIFICFSGNGPINEESGVPITYLEGEVLAYRSPCKVPTDVRKLKAVYKPELTYLKDCIILSANSVLCKRSPASYLGGGDYDGDTLSLFWDESLVKPFKNAEDHYAETPEDFEEENFDKEVLKGVDFLASIEGLEEDEKIRELQNWLLSAVMGDELTGTYSDLHGNAVYTFGYDHPEAIRLARMFCHVLDARKSGLRVKPEVKFRDMNKYKGDLTWRLRKKDDEDQTSHVINRHILKRPMRLGPFVIDVLMRKGDDYREHMMGSFLREPATLNNEDFRTLGQIWQRRTNPKIHKDPLITDQLSKLRDHVDACFSIRQSIVQGRCGNVDEAYHDIIYGNGQQKLKNKSATCSPTKQQKKVENTESNLERLTKIRQLADLWKKNPKEEDISILLDYWDEDDIKRLKLSYLVGILVGSTGSSQHCPFDLDFDGICEMKAQLSGQKVRTILSSIYGDLKPVARIQSGTLS
ncbi:uncharacterized protein L201_002843 [Kwoniella dendrophila CBS 6074]|uniref:RNA-dependent RNA polymerase n=1 Tax=Kwoniella dendrophila CBS 6074 TaxID=1295534 RepID=A0AAX4JTX1_9TREE